MPVYCFKCPACGHTVEELRTIEERNNLPGCPKCVHNCNNGCSITVMQRDINSEGCWSDNTDYLRPVFSESMGVAPHQVRKAQQLHPHIKYQPSGSIRIDSPAEYRRVRKDLGFVDQRPR
jgi:putative FmdB family regulatory protein